MGRPLRSDSLKDIRFDGSPLSLQPRSPFATHGPAVLTWPVADRASPYFLTTFPTTVSPETCGVSLSDPVRAFFFGLRVTLGARVFCGNEGSAAVVSCQPSRSVYRTKDSRV